MKGLARAAVGAIAALAVAGCGGDDSLSKAELAKQANTICKKYAEQGKALGQPDLADPAKAEDYFNKAADLAQKQQDELEELEPSDSIKADYDKLVEVSQDATDLLADLASAAGDKDREQGSQLIQDLTKTSQELDDAATAVGANDCTS